MTIKKYAVTVDGQTYQVTLEELTDTNRQIQAKAPNPSIAPVTPSSTKNEHPVFAPMAGTILEVSVKVGEPVQKGATLCILEAMKMENQIVAPVDGVVVSVHVTKDQAVESNQLLIVI